MLAITDHHTAGNPGSRHWRLRRPRACTHLEESAAWERAADSSGTISPNQSPTDFGARSPVAKRLRPQGAPTGILCRHPPAAGGVQPYTIDGTRPAAAVAGASRRKTLLGLPRKRTKARRLTTGRLVHPGCGPRPMPPSGSDSGQRLPSPRPVLNCNDQYFHAARIAHRAKLDAPAGVYPIALSP